MPPGTLPGVKMGKRVFAFLGKVEETIIWLMLLEMALLCFSQVVMRYVFHTGFSWSEEVLRYQMVFITFFGASLGVKYDAHIGVRVLQMGLSGVWSRYLRLMVSVVSCAFSFVLFYWSARLSLNVKGFGQLTPALGIPSFIPYLSIPIGSFLMGVRFGLKCLFILRERR